MEAFFSQDLTHENNSEKLLTTGRLIEDVVEVLILPYTPA